MRSEAGRGGRVERSFVRALAVTGAMVVAAWLAASALPSPARGAGWYGDGCAIPTSTYWGRAFVRDRDGRTHVATAGAPWWATGTNVAEPPKYLVREHGSDVWHAHTIGGLTEGNSDDLGDNEAFLALSPNGSRVPGPQLRRR